MRSISQLGLGKFWSSLIKQANQLHYGKCRLLLLDSYKGLKSQDISAYAVSILTVLYEPTQFMEGQH